MIYLFFKHLHSGLRWIILLMLLVSILNSLLRFLAKKNYSERDRKFALISLALLHTQVLIGLLLYFISPKVVFSTISLKNPLLRFYLVEHISLMIIAAALITTGYSLAKKAKQDPSRHLWILIFYGAGLILILSAIPWPWMSLGSGWL